MPAMSREEIWILRGTSDPEGGASVNRPAAVSRSGSALAIKRSFDLLGGILLFAVLSPLMFLIALFIFLNFSGPVIYTQARVGLGGRQFRFYKFRTMVTDAREVLDKYLDNEPGAKSEWELRLKLERDPRVTSWGRFLRSWSLDELPQLWNVIKGDISLVGPRPLLPDEIEIYGETYIEYCGFKPGLTGLWQVSGRNCTTFHQRAQLDCRYIEHWSPGGDIRILLLTFPAVLSRRGAY